jgi:hypothetical protein
MIDMMRHGPIAVMVADAVGVVAVSQAELFPHCVRTAKPI